jgi:N-acetylglucosaminyl-diphospho-decaprenol L-rhamnosyltransferase
MNIFVIIVTYKGHQWYNDCFSSLRTSLIPIKTIVVDNASNDGTIEFIEKGFPEIILLKSDKNLGFGQGNNMAIRYAMDNNADYVFLLNQDAWIEPETISELVKIHSVQPNFGVLSPINLVPTKDRILDGFIDLIADYRNIDSQLIDDLYFSKLKDVYNIININASAWLLSKKVLETVGGFDPIFFHYGEDDQYLQRVHYHGFLVGLCPKTRIVHDGLLSCQFNQHMKKDFYKRNLLLICSNINDLEMPQKYIKYLTSRILKKLLGLKFTEVLYSWKELIYLSSNYKSIVYSRSRNVICGSNWIK